MHPTIDPDDIAWITQADMIADDRVMIEDFHIELLQMVNARRHRCPRRTRLPSRAGAPDRVIPVVSYRAPTPI